MKHWTVEEMLKEGPCVNYTKEVILDLWEGKESLSLPEIMQLGEVPNEDKLWVACLPSALAPEVSTIWLESIITRAITDCALDCGTEKVEEWGRGWLSGKDRSAPAACAASDAAYAANAASAATNAAYAAANAAHAAAYAAANAATYAANAATYATNVANAAANAANAAAYAATYAAYAANAVANAVANAAFAANLHSNYGAERSIQLASLITLLKERS